MDPLTVENFVSKQLMLLELEEEAEILQMKKTCQTSSLSDLKKETPFFVILKFEASETGTVGHKHVRLVKCSATSETLMQSLKSGDNVHIEKSLDSEEWSSKITGVLSEVNHDSVTVVSDSEPMLVENEMCYLYRIGHYAIFKRMKKALNKLSSKCDTPLVSVLFGMTEPSCIDISSLNISFFNERLNSCQKEAVTFALCQKEVAIIHGPPGTGKTTTVIEVILQLIKQGLKVLACAPSNVATDNLVEGLAKYKTKMIRVGHPARFLPHCLQYSLDYAMKSSDSWSVVKDIEKEIQSINNVLDNSDPKKQHKRFSLLKERTQLRLELKKRHHTVVKDVLKNCNVIVSTLGSATPDGHLKGIYDLNFDVVVIDECSQALEASCWIPLLLAKKCILSGDHLQLPPVISSTKAAELGLSVTLMERVLKTHGDSVKKTLTVQYRMHEKIMEWSSNQLYDGLLEAHASVASHLLCDLPHVEENNDTKIPLLLIDTDGCHMHDYELEDNESKANDGEAQIVALHVEALVSSGVDASDIAIITPYNLQVSIVKQILSDKYPSLEIRSVDGFQGREKEAVILSLVRSNIEGCVGFLQEHRRLNVAITRAKRHLAVICDSSTVSNNDFLKGFVDYLQDVGEVRTAFQYMNDLPSLPHHVQTNKKPSSKTETKHFNKEKADKKASATNKIELNSSYEKNHLHLFQEDKNDQRSEKYREIVEQFLQSNKIVMNFSPDLSSYDRMLIHMIAEEHKIIHTSEGEGKERYLVLMKPGSSVIKQNSYSPLLESDVQSQADNKDETLNKDVESVTKSSVECHINSLDNIVPKNEKKDNRTNKKASTQNVCCTKPASSKAQANSNPKKRQVLDKHLTQKLNSATDFDELLSAYVEQNNSCSWSAGCKNNMKYLLQKCHFCGLQFCLTHHMPEIHGCGTAAKQHARSLIRKDMKLYPGSGRPQKLPNPATKAALERKLHKKVSELSNERKPKKKN